MCYLHTVASKITTTWEGAANDSEPDQIIDPNSLVEIASRFLCECRKWPSWLRADIRLLRKAARGAARAVFCTGGNIFVSHALSLDLPHGYAA